MMSLSEKDKARVIKLLNLSRSDNDCEAAGAARAAYQILIDRGTDWDKVITCAVDQSPPSQASWDGFWAEKQRDREKRRQGWGPPPPPPPKRDRQGSTDHYGRVRYDYKHECEITETIDKLLQWMTFGKSNEMLRSFRDQFVQKGTLSARQYEVLCNMHDQFFKQKA